jgi:hypothetical protein
MALRKSEQTTARVQISRTALVKFVNQVGGPIAAKVLEIATDVANEVKKEAPVAPKKTHGRDPGYLRNRIYLRPGTNVKLGPYIDVVSPATSPEGFRYASWQEYKYKDYMRGPAQRVLARRPAEEAI